MESLDIIQARHKALQEEYARTREEAKRAYLERVNAEKGNADLLGNFMSKHHKAWQLHVGAYENLFRFEARNGL